ISANSTNLKDANTNEVALNSSKIEKNETIENIAPVKPLKKKETVLVSKPVKTPTQNVVLLPTQLYGNVYDQKTSNPIVAKVIINDLKGNKITEVDTDENGNYSIEISNKLTTKYSINVSKESYIYYNTNILIPANSKIQKSVSRDVAMKQVGLGQVFVLRSIYYEFDKANIKKESFQYLDKLAEWMKKHPNVFIEIGGHTDNNGMEHYNKVLSQNRVNSVMLYLTAKGIAAERLSAIGYGEEHPIASNDDENEGREINRRTEFKITKE
ncbi:MAG: hypothetical protein EAZ27_06495, partial [Cytophagales bacterium]